MDRTRTKAKPIRFRIYKHKRKPIARNYKTTFKAVGIVSIILYLIAKILFNQN